MTGTGGGLLPLACSDYNTTSRQYPFNLRSTLGSTVLPPPLAPACPVDSPAIWGRPRSRPSTRARCGGQGEERKKRGTDIFADNQKALRRLRTACERAKRQLSSSLSATVELSVGTDEVAPPDHCPTAPPPRPRSDHEPLVSDEEAPITERGAASSCAPALGTGRDHFRPPLRSGQRLAASTAAVQRRFEWEAHMPASCPALASSPLCARRLLGLRCAQRSGVALLRQVLVELSRARFDKLLESTFQRCLESVKKCMADAKLAKDKARAPSHALPTCFVHATLCPSKPSSSLASGFVQKIPGRCYSLCEAAAAAAEG